MPLLTEDKLANQKAWWSAYYAKHKDRLNAARTEREKRRYSTPEYREIVRKKNTAYHSKNGDKIRAQQRQHRLENLERKRAEVRDYHRTHANDPAFKAKHSQRGREHYEQNKTETLSRHKAWRKAHPGKVAEYRHVRRARENGAEVNPKSIRMFIDGTKRKSTAVCYYCQKEFSTKKIHFDHIIPLSKGGPHSVENLAVSCPRCNLTKQASTIQDWMRLGQQILAL